MHRIQPETIPKKGEAGLRFPGPRLPGPGGIGGGASRPPPPVRTKWRPWAPAPGAGDTAAADPPSRCPPAPHLTKSFVRNGGDQGLIRVWLKIKELGLRRFRLWFHLPRCYFGTFFEPLPFEAFGILWALVRSRAPRAGRSVSSWRSPLTWQRG